MSILVRNKYGTGIEVKKIQNKIHFFYQYPVNDNGCRTLMDKVSLVFCLEKTQIYDRIKEWEREKDN